MKSRQINFYFMPEDIRELEEYAQKQGWRFVPNRLKTQKIEFVEKINQRVFFVLKNQSETLDIKHIKVQNYYKVNTASETPFIEFAPSIFEPEKKILKRGRVYYKKEYIENDEILPKDADFLEAADKLFKWMKLHFKNTNIKSKQVIISERTAKWQSENQGELSENKSQKEEKMNKQAA